MKKLLIFMLVLGMASWACAAPYFKISGPEPIQDSYYPSDWILIDLVSPEEDPPVVSIMVDCIVDFLCGTTVRPAGGGTADEPQTFHDNFTTVFPGDLNIDDQLVEYMGAADGTVPARGATGTLYSFWYHVPEVPASTLICIQSHDDGGDWWYEAELVYAGGGGWIGTIEMPVPIHVIPEPATIALLGLGGLLLRRRK